MDKPAHFSVTDPDALHRSIRAHPLGYLAIPSAGGREANHIPTRLDPCIRPLGLLSAHVARADPVWQQCGAGADLLVILRD